MQILLLPSSGPSRDAIFAEYSAYVGYSVPDQGQTHYVEDGGQVTFIGTLMSCYFYIMNNGGGN